MVEPDPATRALLADALTEAGHCVRQACDGTSALRSVAESPPDLVLLALNLPDIDGLKVLELLRTDTELRVIILSARNQETDRVAGLELGAVDYVTKPFSVPELIARVRIRLDVPVGRPNERVFSFPGLVIDTKSRQVLVDGNPVQLRRREFDLLAFLAASPGRVFSRRQLLEQVWGLEGCCYGDSTVTEHVRRIREQIECDPRRPRWLQTVLGVGYRFDVPEWRRHTARASAPTESAS